ncbi:hypothetical protein C8J57DRAFT_1506561 [Mycena rebaudengoi]|nr:hypothetical protein C8J57DRAFT_1506561 [Mycena rebaudengoi]
MSGAAGAVVAVTVAADDGRGGEDGVVAAVVDLRADFSYPSKWGGHGRGVAGVLSAHILNRNVRRVGTVGNDLLVLD